MTAAATIRQLARPWREYPSAAELDARTPPDRDRVVDLVRGGSLVVVVFGHSLMALVVFGPDGPDAVTLSNTLADLPAFQPVTWLLQIMPLFFAAGAFANARSYRHATSYPVWLSGRVRRLLRPVLPYVGGWLLVSPLLLWWNADVALPLLRISTQLLWFLGTYVLVTTLTPVLVRLSPRPVVATLGWLTGAVLIDVAVLLGAPEALRLLDFVVVWALAGQTGLWTFPPERRPRTSVALVVAIAALTANVLLVALGPWPMSLVGLPGDEISNMAPPSVVMALHAVTLASLVVLAYPVLTRVAAGRRVWRATAAVNAAALTLYLWHLVGLILALLVLRSLGLDLVGFRDPGWLLPRLLFWAVFGAGTFGLVWVFRPFEQIPLPWWDDRPQHSPTARFTYRERAAVSVAGAVLVAVALLALSVTGLVGFPFNSSTSYAGFSLTPGLAIAVALLGLVVVRAAAVGDAPPAARTPPPRSTVA